MKAHQTIQFLMPAILLASVFVLTTGCENPLTEEENAASEVSSETAVESANEEVDEMASFNDDLASLTAASALDFANPGATTDLDEMAQYIQQALSGNVVGYALDITQNGQLKKAKVAGWARTPADGGQLMKSATRMNVASVTKTVTAVAVLQLLEKNGLTIDSKIWPWLPNDWPKGPGITSLTFRHLLNHTSGAGQKFDSLSPAAKEKWGNDWDGIKYVVGIGMQSGSAYDYKNWNFAVFRVIIPKLWKATGTDPGINQITSFNSGFWYVSYIQKRIFEPSGVSGVVCQPQASYPSALAYNVENIGIGGKMSSQTLASCGGHAGLHLSARALARFMVHIRYNNAVLSPAMRQLMDTEKLGWSGSSGALRWHGGAWYLSGGRHLLSCVMKYPNNVEATLVINSSETAPSTTCGILKNAYTAATS